MLVSYPRSGNTWVRNIVAHLLYQHDRVRSLKDLDRLVPDIYVGIPDHNHYSNPRVIKTHRAFSLRHECSNKSLYRRNIYLVRHPFDVIRSLYHFQLHLWEESAIYEPSFERFVYKLVSGSYDGSWQENVLSWKAMEGELEILFVRYEDLERDFRGQLIRLADFLGKTVSRQESEAIHGKCSLAAMRKMQRIGSLVRQDYPFVREDGARRQLQKDLTPKMKALIVERSRVAMELFEYRSDRP